MQRTIGCLLLAGVLATPAYAGSAKLRAVIEEHGVDPESAALLIIRLTDGERWVVNETRAARRFPPASTSKIPHTLIALETGVATRETTWEWDGVERFAPAWNKDQTLKSAYQASAVWVYQDITSTLGPEAMADWIDRFDYGNEDTGDADDVTTYWLEGPLAISAVEQTEFLRRLTRRQLPVSSETYRAAYPMMVSGRGEGWQLFGKTGWYLNENGPDIGWFVGFLEAHYPEEADVYVFAFNMDMDEPDDRFKRKTIVEAALKRILAIRP